MEALAAVVMFVLCLILPFTLAYFVIAGLIYLLLMFIFRSLRKCKDEKYHLSKEKSVNDQD